MNITVYLGASQGSDRTLADAAAELGRWIGANGHSLVYGGSKSGLMGVLAQSVLEAGGRVTGVEPRVFVEAEIQYDEIDELIVTESFTERKERMIELGDAFIAFPGGTGTLDEISEIMAASALGRMSEPCILYDLNGYYEGLRIQLARMMSAGLSTAARQSGIHFAQSLADIVRILETAAEGSAAEVI